MKIAGRIAAAFIDSKLTPLFIGASLLLGLFAVFRLPREEEPQIIVPMIDVFVAMPGASAAEVEQRVTRPMEKLLWEIPGVEYIYSTSMPSAAMAVVRVKVGEEEVFSQKRGLLEVGFGWVAGLKPAEGEKALVGVKAGETKELQVTIAADFDREDLRGKEALVHLEVAEVLDFEGPTLEEIAKQLGHADLAAWREEVRGKVMSRKEAELDRATEEKALQKVADQTKMDLPERFSERKAGELIQQQAYRMYQRNMPEEDIREWLSRDRKQSVEEVKAMLKRSFVMDAIARKERLVVTEDELQREAARLAQMVGRPQEEVYAQLQQNGTITGMREELKQGKVLKLLRQKAKYV